MVAPLVQEVLAKEILPKMKTYLSFLLILFSAFQIVYSQELDEALKKYLKSDIPIISVEELQANYKDYLILDARAIEEFKVSKLDQSVWVGYENFSAETLKQLSLEKNKKIVVYCSIGVRSEEIARTIKEDFSVEIYNLYGGIFLWKNEGFNVVDKNNQPTNKVHGYSRKWGSYLIQAEVVYE